MTELPSGGFYTIAAWQKALDYVMEIYQVTQEFPRHELYGLTSQLRRASVSVPANIAEGSGRRTIRDYIRFLYIAKGSLTELEYLVHISHRLGYLTKEDFRQLRENLGRTAGTLLGFISPRCRRHPIQGTRSPKPREIKGLSCLKNKTMLSSLEKKRMMGKFNSSLLEAGGLHVARKRFRPESFFPHSFC